ncbi:MAG: hypothetical protein JWO37_1239 [Acidimicrobiales bacterium]|jgi:hypothetical protein|nr:hypothetical protein [Acidimicrobiales bacterium]
MGTVRRTPGRVALILIVLAGTVGLLSPYATGAPTAARLHLNRDSGPTVQHDVTPLLRTIKPADPRLLPGDEPPIRMQFLPQHPRSATGDAAVQRGAPAAAIPTPVTGFNGVGNGFTGPQGTFTVNSAPPDTNSAVGPDRIVEIVNTGFAVFDKSGTAVYGPVPSKTLWTGFGGLCETHNDGDAVVRYDQLADRWIFTQFALASPTFLECFAVSQTSDPTGAYYRYAFSFSSFPDYPKISVWPDAYYASYNLFNGAGNTFLGAEVCALDRSKMLLGLTATQQCYTTSTAYGGLLPSDLDGTTPPPAGAPNVILALGTTSTTLAYWKMHPDFATPANATFTGPSTLTVAAYTSACNGGTCIPQAGTTNRLDSLADRLMFRLAYRNFGTYQSLVASHAVTVGTSVGVRWYELRLTGGNPTVFQQSTYAPDASYRWMSSAAMDQSGNLGIGFSLSSGALKPSVHYSGRLVTDPVNTMTQGEGTFIDGGGSQTGGLTRWGDYSSMTVDPVDGCTFWFSSEYLTANGSFNWSTRLGSFKFPTCGAPATNDFSMSANPASVTVTAGNPGSSTISTTLVAGSAETVNLTASGAPAGVTASLSPTSVTAGGTSTLSLTTTSAAAAGTYPITVTGTAASATHTTTVNLTVNPVPPANDFSMSATPASGTVVSGNSATSTIGTALTAGAAQTVTLSASGLPAGATASFNPTSVSSGGSSTMTITTSGAVASTSTVTITGTGPSATHTTTYTLTITTPPGSSITNGDFEAGTLGGWTLKGAESVTTSGPHSGTYADQGGTTAPTNGDSSIIQTFTAPAGASRLTFWYKMTCPDLVRYDWVTATLRDTGGGSTKTVLPKKCVTNSSWVQVTANVTAGRSYTLTLTSHDDNYASDPSYTKFDDVVVS